MRNENNEIPEEREVRLSKLQVFLYLFIMPLLFTAVITIVLGSALTIFDFSPQFYNAQMWLHNLPLVGAWIPEPQPIQSEETTWAQMHEELMAQWDEVLAERARLDIMAADIAETQKWLTEATQSFAQQQQQRLSRDQRIQFLVTLYSTMRQADAAARFDVLDDESCLEIMLNMDTDVLSRIMALMDVDKVARLTQLMRR